MKHQTSSCVLFICITIDNIMFSQFQNVRNCFRKIEIFDGKNSFNDYKINTLLTFRHAE